MEHPHVCGEKNFPNYKSFLISGTSPRVWGKDANNTGFTGDVRNIPTCVGKSFRMGGCSFFRAEHPHVCGEKGPFYKDFRNFFSKVSEYPRTMLMVTEYMGTVNCQ